MVGKVKEVKDTVKSEDSDMGRSEGWILGKDGFHRADPKWVGDRSETQPPSNNCGPTLVKKLSKSDRAGQVVDRPAPAKARKAKNKAAKASVGRSTYIKQAMTNDGQVGELASTLASMKRDGFALFPQGFNAKYKTTGGIDSTTLGLQVDGDGTTFRLNTTKTYKFETQDGAQVVWEAIKVAKPNSKVPSAPVVVSDPPPMETGVNGSVLMDQPVSQYKLDLEKMSKRRRRELQRRREALADPKVYLKWTPAIQQKKREPFPEKASKTERVGAKKRRKRPKAERDMAATDKEMVLTKAKKKKEVWCEGWRRRKEEKRRQKCDRMEEEVAQEKQERLKGVLPLDLEAQVLIRSHVLNF